MKTPPKVCVDPHCPELQPCPVHQQKPWAESQGRRDRMRSGSKEQRINRAVMERHDGECHVCGLHGADEIDHVVPVSPAARLPEHRHLDNEWVNGMENRKPIHSEPCHREKTAEERARAQRRTRA